MVLGTFIFSVVYSVVEVFSTIFLSPWYLLKVAILWFGVLLAITYGYFLWTHQGYMVRIRSELAIRLAQGLWFGFMSSLVLVGLYEFILRMLCVSKLFVTSADMICDLSLTQNDPMRLFKIMSFFMIVLSTLWTCYLIEPLLAQWYEKDIVDGYGWLIIAGSLLCCLFLWSIAY